MTYKLPIPGRTYRNKETGVKIKIKNNCGQFSNYERRGVMFNESTYLAGFFDDYEEVSEELSNLEMRIAKIKAAADFKLSEDLRQEDSNVYAYIGGQKKIAQNALEIIIELQEKALEKNRANFLKKSFEDGEIKITNIDPAEIYEKPKSIWKSVDNLSISGQQNCYIKLNNDEIMPAIWSGVNFICSLIYYDTNKPTVHLSELDIKQVKEYCTLTDFVNYFLGKI